MRVFVRCVMLTGLLCFLPRLKAAQGQDASDSIISQIRKMKSAVVQIRYRPIIPIAQPSASAQPSDPFGTRVGTGFFVSKQGYVVTAGHVVRESEALARAAGATQVVFNVGILLDLSSTSNIQMEGTLDWVDAALIAVDDAHDLALLKVSRNPFAGELASPIAVNHKPLALKVTVAEFNPTLPPEGDALLISGYPLDIPTFVTQKGIVASESFSIQNSQVPDAPNGFTLPETMDSILVDAVVNPGNSGGPVYETKTGDVVGVCEAYREAPLFTNKQRVVPVAPNEILTQNAGLAVVIPIKYAIDLLTKNGVSDFLSPSPKSPRASH
jgi:S1-C subfamily serine protease